MSTPRCLIWTAGQLTPRAVPLEDAFEHAGDDGVAWIDVQAPTQDDVKAIAAEFGVHALVVEDVIDGNQRPKLERYDDITFIVLNRIVSKDPFTFENLHLLIGPHWVCTLRLGDGAALTPIEQRMQHPHHLPVSAQTVAYFVMDQVVDELVDATEELTESAEQVEERLFGGGQESSHEIYSTMRSALGLMHAVAPIQPIGERFDAQSDAPLDPELKRHARDVVDHGIQATTRVDSIRVMLHNALAANAALVGQQQNAEMQKMTEFNLTQNDQMKKVTSWAAILFAPTLISGIYGMNFHYLPELSWPWGYPLSLLAMLAFAGTLYAIFKWRNWL